MKKVLIAIFALCMLGLSSCKFLGMDTKINLIDDLNEENTYYLRFKGSENTTEINLGAKGKHYTTINYGGEFIIYREVYGTYYGKLFEIEKGEEMTIYTSELNNYWLLVTPF